MIAKLSQELADALHATGNSRLEVLDPVTNRSYTIVDSETHRQAMEALRQQQTHAAIAEGIAQMEAGGGVPIEEAREQTRARLLSRDQ